MAGQRETGFCYRCRRRRRRRTGTSGFWPMAIVCTTAVALQLFGGSTAFTILSPFSYSSLTIKNLLNSVLLSSNANLAGGGRNFKSDVLEDASLITVRMPLQCQSKMNPLNYLVFIIYNLSLIVHHSSSVILLSSFIIHLFISLKISHFLVFHFRIIEAAHHATVISFISVSSFSFYHLN